MGDCPGHRCLAFAPDGRTLAAGGQDHAVYLWELASGTVRERFVGHHGPVTAVAYSHDARSLFSGSSDTTVLEWDLLAAPPDRLDTETAWTGLLEPEASKASRAMRALIAKPGAAVSTLARNLATTRTADEGRIRKAIADLDSNAFARRQAATEELTRAGRAAVPFLRDALRTSDSLEFKRRAGELVANLDARQGSGEELRQLRAVEVLECVANPEARKLLSALAGGAVSGGLTSGHFGGQERCWPLTLGGGQCRVATLAHVLFSSREAH